MLDILDLVPVKRKLTAGGWWSFNAPCCVHNSQSADKRSRGGIKATDQDWSYSCFNCGFTASFKLGRVLSFKARKLLSWMNVDTTTISIINLDSLRHKSLDQLVEGRTVLVVDKISFNKIDLPDNLRLIEPTDLKYIHYLESRSIRADEYPYMVSPGANGRQSNRIVIPYTYNSEVVGYSARYLDDRQPKYINEQQPGYVFGTDLQQTSWTQAIVVEGVFDALAIDGLAVLHNTINDKQAQLINSLHKEVTVVPDQDLAGLAIIDRALELGWAVSLPLWHQDIKDVNDAVKRYSRLGTLLSIMQARETSRIKIELRRKQLVKRLRT